VERGGLAALSLHIGNPSVNAPLRSISCFDLHHTHITSSLTSPSLAHHHDTYLTITRTSCFALGLSRASPVQITLVIIILINRCPPFILPLLHRHPFFLFFIFITHPLAQQPAARHSRRSLRHMEQPLPPGRNRRSYKGASANDLCISHTTCSAHHPLTLVLLQVMSIVDGINGLGAEVRSLVLASHHTHHTTRIAPHASPHVYRLQPSTLTSTITTCGPFTCQ